MSIMQLASSREHMGDSAFYVYEENLIKHNIERFKSIPYANASVHFASMANDNPVLLSTLKDAGFGLLRKFQRADCRCARRSVGRTRRGNAPGARRPVCGLWSAQHGSCRAVRCDGNEQSHRLLIAAACRTKVHKVCPRSDSGGYFQSNSVRFRAGKRNPFSPRVAALRGRV